MVEKRLALTLYPPIRPTFSRGLRLPNTSFTSSTSHSSTARSTQSVTMADEPRKRSRFDQTEPEPRRQSRFDRRSRSPPSRKTDARRSRSPLARGSGSPGQDPAAAAAAAAARINAQLQAKKGVQHVDVPPIRTVRMQVKTMPST